MADTLFCHQDCTMYVRCSASLPIEPPHLTTTGVPKQLRPSQKRNIADVMEGWSDNRHVRHQQYQYPIVTFHNASALSAEEATFRMGASNRILESRVAPRMTTDDVEYIITQTKVSHEPEHASITTAEHCLRPRPMYPYVPHEHDSLVHAKSEF